MTRAFAVAGLILLAACRHAPRADLQQIVIGVSNSPTNLDPGVGLDEISQRAHQLMFSSLMTVNDQLETVPDLATALETIDSQTYVATIPAGVRFHDGRELTSADVVYTFRRFLDPAFVSGRKGAFRDLVAVDALDPRRVAFRLRAPIGSFAANLANIGIVPVGTDASAARRPIGSGPYKLAEFIPDDRLVLRAFPDYYRGAPKNAGVTFKVVPDETMRGLELRKGDVDMVINDVSPDIVHELERDPALMTVRAPGTDFAYMGLNLRDAKLADRRVRHAIGYALDREAIIRYLRRGLAREATGVVPDISWAFARDAFRFTHDPARARALLDDAGYPDPDGDGPGVRLRLTLKTSTAEAYRLQAAVIQQQLAAVGIALDVRSLEFATLFADVINGNIQLYTLIFVGATDPDMLRRTFHSRQVPPSGFNRGHYANPHVDALLDAATAAIDIDKRRGLYMDAQRLIAVDAPIISLWSRTNVVVASRRLAVTGVSPTVDFEFLRHVSIYNR